MNINDPIILKTIDTTREILKEFKELSPTFFVGNDTELKIVPTLFRE